LFQTLTKWILALTFPLAFVVIVFAHPLLSIFGPAFEIGVPVLLIGAVGQLVNCGVGSVGYLLLMSGNQRRLIRVQLAMAGVSVAVNVILIPALGIVGAALAAACVNVAGNLWNLSHVRKALHISPYNRGYLELLVPAACMAACVLVLRYFVTSLLRPWTAIGLALVVSYTVFGGLALICALDPDDQVLARSAWAQMRGGMQKLGVTAK